MKLSLYYPAKPWKVNQKWGISDPKTYSQFGFTRHNGEDIALGVDKMIYAPFRGKIIVSGNQPNGGGIYIGFLSEDKYTFEDGVTSHVLLDFLHLDHVIGQVNVPYKVGDLLAKADNTGFSTGPHTHIQPRRGEWNGSYFVPTDKNDANGSFDPDLYWNGKYAVDQVTTQPKPISAIPEPFLKMQAAILNFQLSEGIKDFQSSPLEKVKYGPATLKAANKYIK